MLAEAEGIVSRAVGEHGSSSSVRRRIWKRAGKAALGEEGRAAGLLSHLLGIISNPSKVAPGV